MVSITKFSARAAIDPRLWLKQHQVGQIQGEHSPFVMMGEQAIADNGGNVRAALVGSPDLRAEIMVAYLLEHAGISKVAYRQIMKAVEIMETEFGL